MVISKKSPGEAFVWVWLPGAAEPVEAGRVDAIGRSVSFAYEQSYLARDDAITRYLRELPLQRVILARHLGSLAAHSDTGHLSYLTYLLESGSDRIGGVDFQSSATEGAARSPDRSVTVEELAQVSE